MYKNTEHSQNGFPDHKLQAIFSAFSLYLQLWKYMLMEKNLLGFRNWIWEIENFLLWRRPRHFKFKVVEGCHRNLKKNLRNFLKLKKFKEIVKNFQIFTKNSPKLLILKNFALTNNYTHNKLSPHKTIFYHSIVNNEFNNKRASERGHKIPQEQIDKLLRQSDGRKRRKKN